MLQPLKIQLRRGAVLQLSVQPLTARMEATVMSRDGILLARTSKGGDQAALGLPPEVLAEAARALAIAVAASPKSAKMKLADFAKQHAAAEHNRRPSDRGIPR